MAKKTWNDYTEGAEVVGVEQLKTANFRKFTPYVLGVYYGTPDPENFHQIDTEPLNAKSCSTGCRIFSTTSDETQARRRANHVEFGETPRADADLVEPMILHVRTENPFFTRMDGEPSIVVDNLVQAIRKVASSKLVDDDLLKRIIQDKSDGKTGAPNHVATDILTCVEAWVLTNDMNKHWEQAKEAGVPEEEYWGPYDDERCYPGFDLQRHGATGDFVMEALQHLGYDSMVDNGMTGKWGMLDEVVVRVPQSRVNFIKSDKCKNFDTSISSVQGVVNAK